MLSVLIRLRLWYLHTFGHCVVCPYPITPLVSSHFWPLCCLSLSDYAFGIFTLLAIVVCPYPITPLVSSHFWPLCCLSLSDYAFGIFTLLAIVLSVLIRLRLWYLHTFGHCVVCPYPITPLVSSHFWPLCCLSLSDYAFGIFTLLAIVLSVLIRLRLWYLHTFGHWPLCCLSLSDYAFGIFTLLAIVLSVLIRLRLWYLHTFGHCVVCPYPITPLVSSHFWPLLSVLIRLRLWYLHTFGHCVVCPYPITPLVSSHFWPLCCLSLSDYAFGIFTLLAIVLSVLIRLRLWYLHTFGHCVVCPYPITPLVSSHFWPLCCLSLSDYAFGIFTPLAIVLSVLIRLRLWYLQTLLVINPTTIRSRPRRPLTFRELGYMLIMFGGPSYIVGICNNSFKPITNTVCVRVRLCKL